MATQHVITPRTRRTNRRDPRLIIIATEGTCTETIYFEDLASFEGYQNSRVQVEVVSRNSNESSPSHVLDSLEEFKRKWRLNKADELWMVIDVDRWGMKKISDVATKCYQKKYFLVVSNPCFEIWLLLHVQSLDGYTETELEELRENKKVGGRTRLELELKKVLGEYNKTSPNTAHFLPFVQMAIARAKTLDITPHERWPNGLGSHVYKLVEQIIGK